MSVQQGPDGIMERPVSRCWVVQGGAIDRAIWALEARRERALVEREVQRRLAERLGEHLGWRR